MKRLAAAVICVLSSSAAADDGDHLAPQAMIDFGLAVIGPAYERPVADHVALLVEAHVFGTYFLPWFDRGDNAQGIGIELRPTWFRNPTGHGLYACAYGRFDGVSISRDALNAHGLGASGGVVGGWVFGLSKRIDLRIGLGVQYIWMRADANGTRLGASTLFPTIDGLIGYRL